MFKFKKSMAGVVKQENFECECCGTMDDQASTGASGCGRSQVIHVFHRLAENIPRWQRKAE